MRLFPERRPSAFWDFQRAGGAPGAPEDNAMEDIAGIPSGWAAVGAAAFIAALALWASMSRKWRRRDAEEEKRVNNYNAYLAAIHDWQDAVDRGDAAGAAMLKADTDRMRGLGWHVAPLVALCLLGLCTAGCWSRKVVVEESPPDVVLLTDHVRIVSPGDEVPALPDGETRWWLCTPTGMRHLLPADAPVNKVGDGQ